MNPEIISPLRINTSFITTFLLFLILILSGCNGKRTQEVTEKYPDGTPKVIEHYNLIDGSKVLYKLEEFYDNGEERIEGFFRDGERHGRWTGWHDNGKLWTVADYRQGKLHGKQTVYYPDGKKFYEGRFEDGIRKGKWRFWNEQGVLENETVY